MYNFQGWWRAVLLALILGASACSSDGMPYGVKPGDFVSVRFQGGGEITRCKVVSYEDKVFTFQVIRRKDGSKEFVLDELVTVA